ncbi:MAG: histidine kinase [Williamsia sp.]|nr:histidine kinase [Williamsia sp.]
MEKLNDRWYRIIGIPVVSLIINIIFYYDMNERHGFSFLQDYLYTVATAYLIWEVNRRIILYTRNTYRLYTQSKQRIIRTTVGVVLSTAGIMTLLSLFYDLTNWWGYKYTAKNYFFNIFSAVTYAVIVCGIYEAIYYFRRWRTVELQAEMLKKENLQSQLDSLKQQVSPHFLFNSLNTLSSLIRKDVDRAELFLDELSKVYRYLLRNNEGELIDLSTELQFIQSFFHLMKTRYGQALQMELHIEEDCKTRLLPPLTLQLLVENAIKHNRIDKLHPLVITLETDGHGRLHVKNNLQRKIISVPSNKIGLSNIASKYKLLGQPGIGIRETQRDFTVTIPLLKTYEYENTDRGR